MSNYPIEIENFHNTLLKLKGITSVESGINGLEGVDNELLKSPEFSHLPHAALTRTNGGFRNEIMIQFEFVIDKSVESLQSLEFLAWFIRDCARNGVKIQLRPFGLPPMTPDGSQLGKTLKFHIDLFIDGIDESLKPALKVVYDLDRSMALIMELYCIPLKE